MTIEIPRDLLVLVPARKGSKRLPHKNRMWVGDKSLLQRTIDVVNRLGLLEQTVLSTDDEVIADEAKKLGIMVPGLRPNNLALDNTSTVDVLKFVLEELSKKQKWSPKFVLLLQLTSPFRDPETIRKAIEQLLFDEGASSIVSGKISQYRTAKTIGFARDHLLHHDDYCEHTFVEADGNFYCIKISKFSEENTFLPSGTRVVLSKKHQSIDIDTHDDYEMAQEMFSVL